MQAAGVEVDDIGAVKVDRYGRTTASGICVGGTPSWAARIITRQAVSITSTYHSACMRLSAHVTTPWLASSTVLCRST